MQEELRTEHQRADRVRAMEQYIITRFSIPDSGRLALAPIMRLCRFDDTGRLMNRPEIDAALARLFKRERTLAVPDQHERLIDKLKAFRTHWRPKFLQPFWKSQRELRRVRAALDAYEAEHPPQRELIRLTVKEFRQFVDFICQSLSGSHPRSYLWEHLTETQRDTVAATILRLLTSIRRKDQAADLRRLGAWIRGEHVFRGIRAPHAFIEYITRKQCQDEFQKRVIGAQSKNRIPGEPLPERMPMVSWHEDNDGKMLIEVRPEAW